nr:hypothetical protein CFP56_73793 [Quercus suber]
MEQRVYDLEVLISTARRARSEGLRQPHANILLRLSSSADLAYPGLGSPRYSVLDSPRKLQTADLLAATSAELPRRFREEESRCFMKLFRPYETLICEKPTRNYANIVCTTRSDIDLLDGPMVTRRFLHRHFVLPHSSSVTKLRVCACSQIPGIAGRTQAAPGCRSIIKPPERALSTSGSDSETSSHRRLCSIPSMWHLLHSTDATGIVAVASKSERKGFGLAQSCPFPFGLEEHISSVSSQVLSVNGYI